MQTKQEKRPNKGNSTADTRKKREEGGKEKKRKREKARCKSEGLRENWVCWSVRSWKAMMVLKSLKVTIGKLELYSKDNRKPLGGFKCYHPLPWPFLDAQCCLCCFWTAASLHHWLHVSLGKADLIGSTEATRPDLSLVGVGQQTHAALLPWWKELYSSKDSWNEGLPQNIQEWGSHTGQSKHDQIPLRLESLSHAALRLFHITMFHRTHFGKFCDFFFSHKNWCQVWYVWKTLNSP